LVRRNGIATWAGEGLRLAAVSAVPSSSSMRMFAMWRWT
jgi:hypothetical protein